jgi:release factor glutamine methyltransferase
MTYSQLASEVINKLQTIYNEREARAIQRYLFRGLLDWSSSDWLLFNQNDVDNEFVDQVRNSIPDLLKYKPVQYVLGKVWFNDMEFIVSPDVLIPRPETELMVKLISENVKKNTHIKVLDIGTGSGAIAISLAYLLPKAEVSAVDISTKALAIAQQNAEIHHQMISFHELDILEFDHSYIGITNNEITRGKFDLIVSNPPYVKDSELLAMENNVLEHEPHLALFVSDNDPLIFYRSIINFAKEHLSSSGSLWLEINETESDNLISLLEKYKYQNIKLILDLNDKPRFINASK